MRVRDPRSAAVSSIKLENRRHGVADGIDFESQVIKLCEQDFIPWVADWLATAADPTAGLKIHWLTQPSPAIGAMARDVLSVLASAHPALEQYLQTDAAEVRANFVTGDQDAWRNGLSQAGQRRLWDAIPQNVKELLALQC